MYVIFKIFQCNISVYGPRAQYKYKFKTTRLKHCYETLTYFYITKQHYINSEVVDLKAGQPELVVTMSK